MSVVTRRGGGKGGVARLCSRIARHRPEVRLGALSESEADCTLPGRYFFDFDTYKQSRAIKGSEVVFSQSEEGGEASGEVRIDARQGECLLRVAERAGVARIIPDLCYTGSCHKCEMFVKGGTREVGMGADPDVQELVRSCMCTIPERDIVEVEVMAAIAESSAFPEAEKGIFEGGEDLEFDLV